MPTRTPVPDAWTGLVADYETHLDRLDLAAHSRRAYVSRLRGYLAWLAVTDNPDPDGGDPLTDSAAATFALRDYRAYLQTVAKAAAPTINAHLTSLANFYTWHGLRPQVPGHLHTPARAPRALEPREIKRLARAVENTPTLRDRALVSTLRFAGLRVAELCALDVDDVPVSARKGRVLVRAGKGGDPREVPMTPELRAVLTEYLHQRKNHTTDESALFVNRYGRRLAHDTVARTVAELGDRVGLEDLSPHVLRHTYGTEMLRAGEDIVTVADLMGHRRIDTTRGYTRSTEADRHRAVGRLYSEHEDTTRGDSDA